MKVYSRDASVNVSHQQVHQHAGPTWLLTIDIPTTICSTVRGPYPQTWAVVDDFGTLIIVREWL